MAKKKALFGVNNYIKKKPKKRKGRHAKNPNKSFNRKISIGQGHP
jgi:hypothetical protein